MNINKFKETHPYPEQSNISALYRFMPVNSGNTEFLEHLFIKKKLYHSLCSDFNDPFEGKPHFTMKNSQNNAKTIRNHLIKVARNNGLNRKDAEALISSSIKRKEFIEKAIATGVEGTFNQLRICSFTTNKENLLFWSHYAKAHQGICVEFDATIMPISSAYKVEYSDDYPQAIYPTPPDDRAFRPALVKAKAWKYENEYRTIFLAGVKEVSDRNNSLLLSSSTIKNIYLGSEISNADRQTILDLILKSSFTPKIWQASLAANSFSLDFTQLSQ